MKPPEVVFLVAGSVDDGRQVLAALQDRFRARREGRSVERRAYCDTFDWRLYRDGGALVGTEGGPGCRLDWSGPDGQVRHRALVKRIPEFAWDLDAGGFRDDLARVAGVRRLSPVVRVERSTETLAILDRREKTVARVHLESGAAVAGEDESAPRPLAPCLRVSSVLGYDDDHASVVRQVEQVAGLHRHEGGELELALAAAGVEPAAYSSKLNVKLDPRMRAGDAARKILRVLLRTMRANEDGTRRDLDSEFLHDFRVAVRRTRSCLGQVKGVFAPADIDPFRKEFAWLGRVTGPTRDLDVYLLNMPEYRRELTESLRGGLAGLEKHVRERKRTEQGRVARALDSARYAKLVREWAAFLERATDEESAEAPAAARAVRDVAAERIGRAYRRVRKRGRALGAGSPGRDVHRLRIDCKKLRYLLEFFRSLFDETRVLSVVRSLKRLQDLLGEFNDLTVQQHDLRATAAEMLADGTSAAETLLAMGCLVGRLERRQAETRRRLISGVRSFVDDDSRAAVRELLR